MLVVFVSDGAGSAKHASIGSRIACQVCAKNAVDFIKMGSDPFTISRETVGGWLDDTRDRISAMATQLEASPRDFAATLVGAIVGEKGAVFLHVGDGAAVYREAGQQDWEVPSWPAQGEFAATTFFITDDPEPQYRVTRVDKQIDDLSLFTDGLERLVLDFSQRTAFSPFFKKIIEPLAAKDPGRDRELSRQLGKFLDGPAVCEKTDDDKTLILASRTSA